MDVTTVDGGRPVDEHAATPRPVRVGRYRIIDTVGEGGMGVVYSAHDPELDRIVAVKLLNPGKTRFSQGDSEGAARLLREAQAMAQLSHPNVIPVFDFGAVSGGVYLAMELVEGKTLKRWLKDERPLEEVLDVFRRAGRGLAAAHQAGLVHRDFKPDNVLIGDDGRVRVADFGLARAYLPTAGSDSVSQPSGSATPTGNVSTSGSHPPMHDDSLTEAGAVVGTPMYMSPEQHSGELADARSDQFAFCVALFEAVYRVSPYPRGEMRALVDAKHDGALPLPETGTRVRGRLRRAIVRGLSPEPDDRFASMHALLAALETPARSRRAWWSVGGLLAVVGVAGLNLEGEAADAAAGTCEDASAQLGEVWTDARRSEVDEALRTGSQDAAELASRTTQALDAYASAWSEAWTSSCNDATVRRCLERRRHRLDAVVEVLADADAAVSRRAVGLVGGLPPVSACTDPGRAVTLEAPPEVAAEVDAIRAELDRVMTLEGAGKPREALLLVVDVVEHARDVAYAPVLGEALYRQGRLLRATGNPKGARDSFDEAMHIGEAHRHDRLAANTAVEMMLVLGLSLDELDAAKEWARRAEAATERLDDGALVDARRRHMEGIVMARSGEFARARELMSEALELRREIQGNESLDVAANLLDLGAVLGDLERPDEALAVHREALATWTALAGDSHQNVGFAHMNIGAELHKLDLDEEALEHYGPATEILTRILGADHPATISALNNAGTCHQSLGHLDIALQLANEVLEKRIAREGDTHRSVARAYGNRAVVFVKLKRWDEAREDSEKALRIMETALGTDHPELMTPSKVLAEIMMEQGEGEAALPLHDRALELAIEAYGADNYQVGRMHASRAATELQLGDLARARDDAREALARFDGDRHAYREAEVRFVLARAQAGLGAKSAAAEEVVRARARLDVAQPDDEVAGLRAKLDAWSRD